MWRVNEQEVQTAAPLATCRHMSWPDILFVIIATCRLPYDVNSGAT